MALDNPTKHVHSAGFRLRYSANNGSSWTEIEDMTSVDTPPLKRGAIPASTLSTLYKVSRKQPGWIDPGEWAFQVALTAAQLLTLFTLFFNGTDLLWQQIAGNAHDGTFAIFNEFTGYVSALQAGKGMQRDQNENINVDLSVQVTTITPTMFDSSGTGT